MIALVSFWQAVPPEAWWINIIKEGGTTALLVALIYALMVVWRRVGALELQIAAEQKEARLREAQLHTDYRAEIQKLHDSYHAAAKARESETDTRVKELETCFIKLGQDTTEVLQQNTLTVAAVREDMKVYQRLESLQATVVELRGGREGGAAAKGSKPSKDVV